MKSIPLTDSLKRELADLLLAQLRLTGWGKNDFRDIADVESAYPETIKLLRKLSKENEAKNE